MSAIDKVEILKKIGELAKEGYIDEDDVPPIERAVNEMKTVPTTMKGQWHSFIDTNKKEYYRCKCGFVSSIKTTFCSHCGCYMKSK